MSKKKLQVGERVKVRSQEAWGTVIDAAKSICTVRWDGLYTNAKVSISLERELHPHSMLMTARMARKQRRRRLRGAQRMAARSGWNTAIALWQQHPKHYVNP